jgi:exopolyphosphatase/guanosine-5'-triphosphate,3'-diphosphate pyrophosphatase
MADALTPSPHGSLGILDARRRESADGSASSGQTWGGESVSERPDAACFAALDLGTNNCRLLIATPAGKGFRIVEAYSRIVRLGDGLSRTGRLDDAAMARTIAALKVCADRIRRRNVVQVRAVATQACRAAANGAEFVAAVARETGLKLQIIAPEEEARLSVAGCLNLLDYGAAAALVVDVGGGSTELSWVDLTDREFRAAPGLANMPIRAWVSAPVGVVTLAERFPEPVPATKAWFRAMVEHVKAEIGAYDGAEAFRPVFDAGRAQLIGTSGAITSLAGMHLGLRRYERSRVDGLWLRRTDCEAAADKLMALDLPARAAEPCIGRDRADLVLAGAAILQAVQELWPCERVRVADRGLREGILLSLVAENAARSGRRRRRHGRRGLKSSEDG